MNLRLHIFFGQFVWLISVLNGKSLQGIPGYGRNLVIKTIPAVEDYQSALYEVFMEPYLYELGSGYPVGDRSQKQIELAEPRQPGPGLRAIVHLEADQESGVEGELIFTQIVPNGPVQIEGNVTGLPAGLHGLHVHQSGDINGNCMEIGPHFIAYYGRHGGPRDHIRHVGDLGNIKAEEGAPLNVKIFDHLISLTGPRSIVGRSIAITKSEDDYGRASTEDSALTGTSGPAIACGVIGYLN
ncbi:superoxide dismutase [Cu-Zn]-like [Maniola hyperantus]|uniref:superoxide dismutase [Cu-Zn]-like n=1 Tax=Aphantopus hyperantus TaxID=2795564 RepID=UPI00156A4960|nr:superoxide dismutase [Cu-Zn]-like [Maniola hyperantus]XP_034840147.1 superoxide dismutase [Cu-Zn]-like [Maniola hyperantus]